MTFSLRSAAIAGLATLFVCATAGAAEAPRLDLKFTPEVENGKVTALAVEEHYSGSGALSPLSLSETLGPLFHIADRIQGVSAEDGKGALPLKMTSGEQATDDATPLGGKIRIWTPERQSVGDVVVRYRALVSHETLAGPSWEVRSEPRGVSAAGLTFLLLPGDKTPYRVSLKWDLSQMPKGASTLTSLPDDMTKPMPLADLRETYYMAGRLHRVTGAGGAYRAASTADTPYDQMELLNWTADAYARMLKLFGKPERPTFTVMFRGSTISKISGTELPGALQATMMADTPLADVENLAAHEMTHVFMGGLDPVSWYEEGLAVVYQHRAPFITGMIGADAYIADINQIASAYYRNVRYNMPMEEATKMFWTDARARLQPYNRGAMYFNLVDAKLKAKTHGKRGLDQVMHDFIADRNAGKPVTVADWLKLVAKDVGPETQTDYQNMMSGKKIFLPSDAFGPCFHSVKSQMPVFELGFDIISLMQFPRVIHGLKPDSPAAKAGLREGDKVVWATSLDSAQETPEEPMLIRVDRGGQTAEIRFFPRGHLTDVYQWVRDPKMTDDQCRF